MRDDRYIDALLSEERANATLAGIDPRSHALARVAALIALDAAPPSYMSAVQAGLEAGASYDEIVGTLIAVMPIVGVARVVSAAPESRPRARLRRRRGARARGARLSPEIASPIILAPSTSSRTVMIAALCAAIHGLHLVR